jgi:hypothetical protein
MKLQVTGWALQGALLDAAVAKAEGVQIEAIRNGQCIAGTTPDRYVYAPSSNWTQGGPIIEHERGAIFKHLLQSGETLRWIETADLADWMRAYVGSKFGDEVKL